MGNQPKTTTRVARLGIGQGGTDVPFCAGRLLCSRFAHCSADPMNSGEVVVEHVEVLGLSAVSSFCSVLAAARRAPTSLSRHTR